MRRKENDMVKYYCDRCGAECEETYLTEVAIPKEKKGFGSFSTDRITVCSSCNREYEKVIDALTDIRFLMFERFYPMKGE